MDNGHLRGRFERCVPERRDQRYVSAAASTEPVNLKVNLKVLVNLKWRTTRWMRQRTAAHVA